ncbi:hypothetical protein CEE37_14470 [candidate division LCP-89 bacterium B3_LCP]|uniref:Uncharacterized protein n=1 Tax=candidate division LCP-89 bacterium B3_LCP TaxID=2012998 RepID=A0A532UPP9_UNCL8|nr:MAG: hypothetical protein CEE37_14470 [candidate division LCP-89 bacterium B3_LCP]
MKCAVFICLLYLITPPCLAAEVMLGQALFYDELGRILPEEFALFYETKAEEGSILAHLWAAEARYLMNDLKVARSNLELYRSRKASIELVEYDIQTWSRLFSSPAETLAIAHRHPYYLPNAGCIEVLEKSVASCIIQTNPPSNQSEALLRIAQLFQENMSTLASPLATDLHHPTRIIKTYKLGYDTLKARDFDHLKTLDGAVHYGLTYPGSFSFRKFEVAEVYRKTSGNFAFEVRFYDLIDLTLYCDLLVRRFIDDRMENQSAGDLIDLAILYGTRAKWDDVVILINRIKKLGLPLKDEELHARWWGLTYAYAISQNKTVEAAQALEYIIECNHLAAVNQSLFVLYALKQYGQDLQQKIRSIPSCSEVLEKEHHSMLDYRNYAWVYRMESEFEWMRGDTLNQINIASRTIPINKQVTTMKTDELLFLIRFGKFLGWVYPTKAIHLIFNTNAVYQASQEFCDLYNCTWALRYFIKDR